MPLFRTGDGTDTDTIIVALELISPDWFRRNLIGALELMCNEENWEQIGDADVQFARDKANEMLEGIQIDVIIPPPTPVGATMLWAGVVEPDGWIICDGRELNRTTYADLFDAIGTLWGDGNGTTTFNIPDLTYRIPMGASSSPALDVGQLAGEAEHTLTAAEMPTHNHTITQTPHSHPPVSPATVFVGRHATGSTDWIRATAGATFDQMSATGTANANITLANAGSGSAHNNIPPVAGVYFIIHVE